MVMVSDSDALEELTRSLPDATVIRDPAVAATYASDAAPTVRPGRPLAVVRPTAREHVVTALEWASEHEIPVVPRGAGSGLAGGAAALSGGVTLAMHRMNRIVRIDYENRFAVVEPGVTTAALDAAARKGGLMYAPDPGSAEVSTIGGNIATNAGGLRCVKYGTTRDSVLEVEGILADGRIIHSGSRARKNVAGYDLASLLVGSEGTLAVTTSATVKLCAAPVTSPVTVVGSFPDVSAAAAAACAIARSGLGPSMLELMDGAMVQAISRWRKMGLPSQPILLSQFDTPDAETCAPRAAEICKGLRAEAIAISDDDQESAELLKMRRLAYPAAARLGRCLVEDVCVPIEALPELLARISTIGAKNKTTVLTVAHAGDGNVHPNLIFEGRELDEIPPRISECAEGIFNAAMDLGGTLTGEHGVGILKRKWLTEQLGDVGMSVQRAIKLALDPRNILNPGRGI